MEAISDISSPKEYKPGIYKGRGYAMPSPPPLDFHKIPLPVREGGKGVRTARGEKQNSTRASSLVTERSKNNINEAFKTFTNFNKLLHGRVARPMVAPVPYSFGLKFKNLSEKVRYEKQVVEILKLKKLILSEPSTAGQHLIEVRRASLSSSRLTSLQRSSRKPLPLKR